MPRQVLAAVVALLSITACGGSPEASPPSASPSTVSPSPSPSPSSPTPSASPTTAKIADLSLELLRVPDYPSCFLYFEQEVTGPMGPIGLYAGVAVQVKGVADVSSTLVTLTRDAGYDYTRAEFQDGRFNGRTVTLPRAPGWAYLLMSLTGGRYRLSGYVITVSVDPKNEVPERNERNNVLRIRVTAPWPPTPERSRCSRLS